MANSENREDNYIGNISKLQSEQISNKPCTKLLKRTQDCSTEGLSLFLKWRALQNNTNS